MKKKLLIATAVALPTIGLAGSAMAMNGNEHGMKDQVAEKLATRFNLNKDEVSAFMTEQQEARHAEMEKKVTESLKSAGFSDEQITALQNKKQEQRAEHEEWRNANPDATQDERQAHRQAEKAEFETWAKGQGIDLTKVRDTLKESGFGRGMHRGPRSGKDL